MGLIIWIDGSIISGMQHAHGKMFTRKSHMCREFDKSCKTTWNASTLTRTGLSSPSRLACSPSLGSPPNRSVPNCESTQEPSVQLCISSQSCFVTPHTSSAESYSRINLQIWCQGPDIHLRACFASQCQHDCLWFCTTGASLQEWKDQSTSKVCARVLQILVVCHVNLYSCMLPYVLLSCSPYKILLRSLLGRERGRSPSMGSSNQA